jgi:DNA-binding transcriptional MerR regulator
MSPGEPETYTIEQAGETLGVSVADIESYLQEGLVVPREGPGGTRIFTRVQMRRLWSVVTLHRDLGINLPGVAAVLRLREQFEQVRRDLVTLVEIVERELGPDVWDRLWPQGRPRPDAHISVDGFSDLSDRPAPEDSREPRQKPGGESGGESGPHGGTGP